MADGVEVQVCVECGKEYFYDDAPPADKTCERCGNAVFRSFYDAAGTNEAAQDFEETTSRDLLTDDPSTDVTPGDLYDLNNP
ncbi:MAG TPA: hypothetical protein VM100_00750 [Longimicrobiales bacterium]|nr:hypothetical protein [Longimicrobiales bacterium]